MSLPISVRSLKIVLIFCTLSTSALILVLMYDNSKLLATPMPLINQSYDFTDNNNKSRIPLDLAALEANFAQLKEDTKPHTNAKFRQQLDSMMRVTAPMFPTETWRLHSPAERKNYTVEQLQDDFVRNLRPGFLVPNVAHIILPFVDRELKFYQLVDILSCIHVMKPDRLLLWYAQGKLPQGHWWEKLQKNLSASDWESRIIMAQRPIPTSIYSVPVHVREHQSDVMRMEAVLTFGGFYMDLDVIVLKPLDALRKYPCTIGREVSYGLCNGAFLSAPNGTFLAMWYTAYQVFDDQLWGDHSVLLPHSMHKSFPTLCHVEEESMDRPNWTPEEVEYIYETGKPKRWDWRTKNYVMHLWYDKYGKDHNMETIKSLDSLYGQMSRFIIHGIS